MQIYSMRKANPQWVFMGVFFQSRGGKKGKKPHLGIERIFIKFVAAISNQGCRLAELWVHKCSGRGGFHHNVDPVKRCMFYPLYSSSPQLDCSIQNIFFKKDSIAPLVLPRPVPLSKGGWKKSLLLVFFFLSRACVP